MWSMYTDESCATSMCCVCYAGVLVGVLTENGTVLQPCSLNWNLSFSPTSFTNGSRRPHQGLACNCRDSYKKNVIESHQAQGLIVRSVSL
jgi:hypothetical protein